MVRVLRVVLVVVGVVLVVGSSTLTWVNVELDTDALTELAREAEDLAVGDDEVSDLIDDAGEVIETARDLIPDRLLEASLNGQNAFDLFGVGFLLAGLAFGAATTGAIWAVGGSRWLRWIAILLAVALLALTVLVPISVITTESLLNTFLPANWEPFSPSFDVTTAPLGAIAGAAVIFVALLGRSPTPRPVVAHVPPPSPVRPPSPLPPPPPPNASRST